MKLISLRLTKKEKKDAVEVCSPSNGPDYPYGTHLSFDKEQIDKIPGLDKVKAGDMISGGFEAKVIEVRITDRDKDQQRHNVEIQIQKIGITNKESYSDAFDEAGGKVKE